MKPILLILKNELRLEDNPLFIYASSQSKPIIPIFILDKQYTWSEGAASKIWLKNSLLDLRDQLQDIGLNLIFRKGDFITELKKLIQETKADEIIYSRSFENETKNTYKDLDQIKTLNVKSFNSFSLFDPDLIRNKSGGIFKVFTPYYKHCLTLVEEEIVSKYKTQLMDLKHLKKSFKADAFSFFKQNKIKSLDINDNNLALNNQAKWQNKLLQYWDISSKGASNQLKRFVRDLAETYSRDRDFPRLDGTSKLSPYLHFGQISPFRIWKETEEFEAYQRQLVWREFAIYILYHFPDSSHKNLDQKFNKFKWQKSKSLLEIWQKGLTGYPIVDAGMRELWETGWMHNRVRMIVGSFLVKDLLIPWQEGAKWFWDTLLDADLANNSMGWQWVAGSGVDASPFFRIFNPILQGEKFDPDGAYVKKWCPELSKLDSKWLHKPFEAPPLVLQAAGIKLGRDYPVPIINHFEARDKALELLKATKYSKPKKKT